jgi:protein-disulfide isomerase/uncharacterized membrane protein
MTPLSRKLLLIFAVIGLAAAATSSYVHHQLLTVPNYTSVCDVNAHVSCSQAYLSRYGSFWGVPVAIGGVIFFVLVLVLAGFTGRATSAAREAAPAYIFALSTVGLAFILYLAWASYVQLKTFCVLCAITYVAVIAIFIISGGATTFPMTTLPRRAIRDLRTLVSTPLALLIALVLVGGSSALVVAFPRESPPQPTVQTYQPLTDKQRADLEKWWEVQPKVDLPIPSGGEKVLIVKFSDYMCPACRQTFESYKGVLAKYLPGGQVRFVLKHFPLEAECNPKIVMNHYASCEAAAAVIIAKSKGTGEKLEQWIFDHQTDLTANSVKQAAKDVGGIQDFDARYAQALQEVKADASMGQLLGVNSTPTFYINGRKVAQSVPPQYFDALIEMELKRTK